jgi:hypothetical protein
MTLSNEQLQRLKNYINTIPTQYGIELLTFFAQVEQEQQVDQQPSESEEMDS